MAATERVGRLALRYKSRASSDDGLMSWLGSGAEGRGGADQVQPTAPRPRGARPSQPLDADRGEPLAPARPAREMPFKALHARVRSALGEQRRHAQPCRLATAGPRERGGRWDRGAEVPTICQEPRAGQVRRTGEERGCDRPGRLSRPNHEAARPDRSATLRRVPEGGERAGPRGGKLARARP